MNFVYRRYYMPTRGYEFYVCNSISHEWAQRTSEILVEHEKIKFVSTSRKVIFCLLHKHTNDKVFDNFPKISTHFPKIFQNCSESQTNTSKHFPNISCRLLKMTWRCFDHTSTNLSVVKGKKEKCHQKGMISSVWRIRIVSSLHRMKIWFFSKRKNPGISLVFI